MKPYKNWIILKQSLEEIFTNRIFKLSAALAYYTIFSIPGLIIIILWVSDTFYGYGHKAVEGSLYGQIAGFVGSNAALQIQETIKNATLNANKGMSTLIGLGTLIFGATSVFAEIQDSINIIWRLKAKPQKGKGWLKLIIDRLLSFSIVITLGFLLLVSLIVNGLMDVLLNELTKLLPASQFILAYASNMLLTFIITSFLFGLIFKVLPDARIRWKAVRVGAFATAFLFLLGKFLIGYYLGHSRMSSVYGAAGSIIIILLWVYYSSVILYFGAAFTRVYAIHHNMQIYPSQYAVWVEHIEIENDTSIQNLPNDMAVAAHKEQIIELNPDEPKVEI
jgi:membrane protein